jgi:polar amino acid transport system substrate-binding protein
MRNTRDIIHTALASVAVVALAAACGGGQSGAATEPAPSGGSTAPAATALPVTIVASPSQPAAQGEDDWARISASKKLLVGTSADYIPFSFYASDFKLDGFDVALIRDLGRRLGLEVELNDFAFDGLAGALRMKQVDAVIAAMSVTPERQQAVDFTNAYYVGEDAVLATVDNPVTAVRSATDMAGKKIGVQRGSVHETWLQQALVETGLVAPADLRAYASSDEVLRELRAKQVDLAVLDFLPAQTAADQGGLKMVGRGANLQRFAIAVRKGSTLLPQLSQALQQAQADGTVARLVEEYLQLESHHVSAVPTAVPAATAAPAPTAAPAATAAPQPVCVDGMAYVADLNLDDAGMTAPPAVQAGQAFSKAWRIRNAGTCAWAADYALAFARGNVPDARMGGSAIRIGREVKPGETIDLQANLVAPGTPGVYQGFWQMQNEAKQSFGETVWVGIQVPGAQPPAPTAQDFRLRADAVQINAGQCTTIRWSVDNVNSVFFVDGAGNPQGVGGNDARNVCPAATATYMLRVTLKDGRTVEQPITITVGNAAPNFRADATQLSAGQCTTLRWNIDGVRGVYLSDGGAEQGVGGNDARTVCPASTTTYRLRVELNDGRAIQQSVTVSVAGTSTNIDFRADAASVSAGQCTTLRWNVANAKAVYLNQGAGEALVGGQAELQVCPQQTTTYVLRVTRDDGRDETRGLVVSVNQPQPARPSIDSFTVDQNQITAGQCVTLRWATRNVPSNLVLKRGDTLILDNAPPSGALNDCPAGAGLTTYTLIAAGESIGDSTVSQSVTVDVKPNG